MRINKYHFQVLIAGALAIIAICIVAFVVAWARTLTEVSGAEAFIEDAVKLEVGKSTFEEVKLVAEKHAGQPQPGSGPCTDQACEFHFLYENKPLSSMYIQTHIGFIGGIELRTGVPYVGLMGALDVRNGVLTERFIHYVRYARKPFAYNVRETVLPAGDTREARGMRTLMGFKRMQVDSAGIPSAVSVGLEPSTSADERRRAYALNVSCLSKVFGCNGPSAIFPSSIPYRGIPYQTETETW